ncbi:HalOD1 output domain-containing protein [Halorubrum sp. N11]|uniref:HalOD1 output domain-containing protein n=1 Tax=Halorubrum sp. N11 TaxID=3402276 RepID=UPI003EB99F3F
MGQESLNVYRTCKPVVDAEYDPESDISPVEATIEALAEAAGVDTLELPPIYDFVDPDAINHLFGKHKGASEAETLLSFQVNNWNVFIRDDGRIRICDNTQLTDPKPVFN